jgi:hypothetical protein
MGHDHGISSGGRPAEHTGTVAEVDNGPSPEAAAAAGTETVGALRARNAAGPYERACQIESHKARFDFFEIRSHCDVR